MTETSLTKDPFVRRTALTAGLVALLVLVLGAGAYLLSRSGDNRDFSIAIGLVSPTDANRVTMSSIECPGTDRASTPLPDSNFEPSTDAVDRTAFGGSQVVAYNVQVAAADSAPDTARFVLRFSDAFDPGLACAFISVDDPDHAEGSESVQLSWSDASGAEPAGQIELAGITGGDEVVVQVWAVLGNDDQPSRQMSLTVSPGTDTDADTVSREDRASLGLPATASGEPTLVIDDGADPAVLGESSLTRYVVTNDTDAVLNRVEVNAALEADGQFTGGQVEDRIGYPSSCRADEGALTCDLGYLNPGESVTIEATVAVDPTAVSFWGRSRGPCLNDNKQDLCQRATLSWAGPFSPDSLSTSEITNIDDTSVFSVQATPTVDTGYALGSVTVNILVTTDVAAAELTEVSTTGCPVASYAGGDTDRGPKLADPAFVTDGDGVVNEGELWLFTCSARQYVDGIIEVVVAGTADGVPGRTLAETEIEVISPALTVARTEGAEVTWAVTNSGDVPLEGIAVSAAGCEPTRTDAGNGDGVLDVFEAWTYTCPSGAGTGRAFGIDPLGATVSGVDETAAS